MALFSLEAEQSSGTEKSYLDLSPEGYNKIIKDILSSDAGLASLATGENLSGGYGASVKAQLAQDLVLNIAGEMAKLTAPTVKTEKKKSAGGKIGGKLGSVICTELHRQGRLPTALYELGYSHFSSLHPNTVLGYRSWAEKIVPLMRKSKGLSKFLAPIAVARYRMIVLQEFSFIGAATIYFGQPICFVIGSILVAAKENHGDLSATTH